MFLDLYKLYKKNGYSDRSPLEDFNTEVFAGILRLCPCILKDFTALLDLPEDEYEIDTQLRRGLTDRADCIIDLVLKGKENICFIENKVNSEEGWEQLDRYCEALDFHYKNVQKYLVYCTKYTDHKTEHRHNFKQIRWYQIAEILRPYSEKDAYLFNYLEFLNHHNMSQKNTFSPEMVMALKKINEAAETLKIHVQNSRPNFENIFNLKNSSFQDAITNHKDRVASYISPILPGSTNNELLYCIKSSLFKLQTQVFINTSHPKFNEVKEAIDNYIAEYDSTILAHKPHKDGLVIFMEREIYDLINDSEADDKIKNWFIDSFYEFSNFFKATPQLGWIPQLLGQDLFYEYREYLRKEGYASSTIQSYVQFAEQNMKSSWKEDWTTLDILNTNEEVLEKMKQLTFGNHGPSFQGKHSFRKFLEHKIIEKDSINA